MSGASDHPSHLAPGQIWSDVRREDVLVRRELATGVGKHPEPGKVSSSIVELRAVHDLAIDAPPPRCDLLEDVAAEPAQISCVWDGGRQLGMDVNVEPLCGASPRVSAGVDAHQRSHALDVRRKTPVHRQVRGCLLAGLRRWLAGREVAGEVLRLLPRRAASPIPWLPHPVGGLRRELTRQQCSRSDLR